MPTKEQIDAKQQEIKDWWKTCDPHNPYHRQALLRAARQLFARQTGREQESHKTRNRNGRGFNSYDAEFGSRLAKHPGDMDIQMATGAMKILRKYSRQLAEIKLGIP